MNLYSLQFVLFLVASLAAYYVVWRVAGKWQWVVLLVARMGFYLATGWQNLFFILFTAATTFAVGLAFGRLDGQAKQLRAAAESRDQKKAIKAQFKRKKWLVLLAALVTNFGVLGYLKYWNTLLGFLGAQDTFLASKLLLPLGISFYTFQSIGYVIDCYNGKFEPERNFARYLLFVSFFPQLIQGPIGRFDDLAHQLYERHRPDPQGMRRGLLLIAYGVFKKYAIADVLIGTISASLDTLDASTSGSVVALGILLYTVQQYGDLSGGIDMVRGVAKLFGITMARNFNQPYFSVSLADFWRRWHMTLGAWMRDYVFYPLAVHPTFLKLNTWGTKHLGKTVGRTLSACVGNFIVFLLVGLWHGAEVHYILWGLYNGLVIAASDMLRPAFERLSAACKVNVESRGYHVFAIVRTFLLVNIGRYFDRLTDAGDLATGFA
ncbi:MAG: MBOAT family protein, partial [Eggerthellaceae bacterium]|nr:MBOAT family protein [Eggerthellaceae bacterium]